MTTQIIWQEEKTLTDNSTIFNVVLLDKITDATITIAAVDESHADEICRQLLIAGFNSERKYRV